MSLHHICILKDAVRIGILEICYAMAEFTFLNFSIEALVIHFYKKTGFNNDNTYSPHPTHLPR